MGFFSNESHHVSHHELDKDLYHLKEKEGFSDHQIHQIKQAFRGDMEEAGAGKGISHDELRKGIEWFKDHQGEHHLSSEHITKLEERLGRHF